MSETVEIVAVWAAIGGYVASSIGFVVGVILARPRAVSFAVRAAVFGWSAHLVAIAARWVTVGHGPYLGFYEVASVLSFIAVGGLLLLVRRRPALSVAGAAVMPVAFLVLGASLLGSREAQAITPSLASIWLVIHVIFANLAFGAYAVSFGLASAYLLKLSGPGSQWEGLLGRFPSTDELDGLTYRWVGAGFVFQTIMIASGSVWADQAWGRYWGWDPVETWSLIAWAIYAIYLHLTLTLGWRGRKAAWIAVIALPVILFSLLGVPIAYNSIHGAYLSM